MNKVYILYNCDVNEVIAVSEDENLMREMMCDQFMDDVLNDWYFDQTWRPYEVNERPDLANRIWEETLEYYDEYIMIMEEEVIK